MIPDGAVADRAAGALQVDVDLRYLGIAVCHPGAALRHIPIDLPNRLADLGIVLAEVADLSVDPRHLYPKLADLAADLCGVPVGVSDRPVALRDLPVDVPHLLFAIRQHPYWDHGGFVVKACG